MTGPFVSIPIATQWRVQQRIMRNKSTRCTQWVGSESAVGLLPTVGEEQLG